jgi:hypothetical protein
MAPPLPHCTRGGVKSQFLKLSNPFKFNSNHTPKRFKPEKIKTKVFLESGPISLFYLGSLIFPAEAAALFPSLSCGPKKFRAAQLLGPASTSLFLSSILSLLLP